MAQSLISKQIEDYIDYCENVRQMTKVTIQDKKSILRRFGREVKCNNLRKLTNVEYNDWVKEQVARGISARSVNVYNQSVVAMLRYYKEMGMDIPCKLPLIHKLKELPPKRNFYSRELIKEVVESTDDEVAALMIRITFDTGMRLNELTNLRIRDFKGRMVTFIGKGRIVHNSFISEETYKHLTNYINTYDIQDYLWSERNSTKPICPQSVSKRMKLTFQAFGIDDFHPHSLRHSFATDLQKQGASVQEIQHMIGHSNVAVTENYLHGFQQDELAMLFDKYH